MLGNNIVEYNPEKKTVLTEWSIIWDIQRALNIERTSVMLLTVEHGDPLTTNTPKPHQAGQQPTKHGSATPRPKARKETMAVLITYLAFPIIKGGLSIFLLLWALRFPNTVGFHGVILHEQHRQAHPEGAWGKKGTREAQTVFVSQSRQNFCESSSLTQRDILR